jgi:GMP synthase (glutamine-hydrolysing)
MPLNASPEDLAPYKSFIISGGGASVYEKNAPKLNARLVAQMRQNPGRWKVLGICYGTQLLNDQFGGVVASLPIKEYGKTLVRQSADSVLFEGVPGQHRVLMNHGDSLEELAEGFRVTARSEAGIPAAVEDQVRGLYGVQFHPEATAISTHGKQIIGNFLYKIAGYEPAKEKTIDELIEEQREKIRQSVKPEQRVFFGLSGGVDSTVAAYIAEQVLGPDRCAGFIIDTGGMRKGEVDWVYSQLSNVLKMRIYKIDARNYFLNTAPVIQEKQDDGTIKDVQYKKLSEETNPAKKRIIFSKLYNDLFRKIVTDYGFNPDEDAFGQGTLRPDIIESRSTKLLESIGAKQIKKHHNVDLDFKYNLEPNEDLHKDQIRLIAQKLGLPPQLAFRQPFPGPGLFCRTVCADAPSIDDKYCKTAEQLKKFSEEKGIETILLPIKTVGIKGDDRSVDYAAVIAGKTDWESLAETADQIPRLVHGVNRVYYLFGKKTENIEPATLVTPTHLTPETLDQLREADAIVNLIQERAKIDSRQIAQFPVSLLPVNFGKQGTRTIALRPFITEDFYTGLAAIPTKGEPDKEHINESVIFEMVARILGVKGVGAVLLDLSSKPPGTTEVE